MATLGDLAREIIEATGIESSDLPHVETYVDTRGQVWKHGEAAPNKKTLTVFSIFMEGDDVRVYLAPVGDSADPFTRYTLHRAAPTLVAESMAFDVFKHVMAGELELLWASVYGDEDDEDTSTPPPPPVDTPDAAAAPDAAPPPPVE
jgi:hypothetical protein